MRVTVRHVAQLANVSPITVSRVINHYPNVKPDTRKAVEEAMRKLNYYPNRNARSLASAKAQAIGLIIPVSAGYIFSNPLYTSVLQSITSFFDQHSYRILLHTLGMGSDYAALFHEKWIDGAILMSITPGDKGFMHLYTEDFPIVMTSPYSEELDIPMVDIDNVKAAREAVDYLIETGHRRIGLLTGPPKLASCRMRTTGYKEACLAAGLPIDPDLMVSADFDDAGGYQAMRRLLSQAADLDAVFVLSDIQAIGAMRALRESGARIPADISIIGFDGIGITEFVDPPLTTVAQPAYEKGETAAKMLLSLMRGETLQNRQVVLPHRLVKRASVQKRR